MLTVVTTSLNHTQVDSKDIALIMSDIDRARDFTNGLSDKAKRVDIDPRAIDAGV
ncbi:hypothetical protein BCU41_025930 [Vibrio lentus]|uniref:hypothetical protein n=1 Tax=Vibrio lentus TaxID=136468 RepID=UPI0039A6E9A8